LFRKVNCCGIEISGMMNDSARHAIKTHLFKR
jgi:hypothetical protein